ncbi:50S ribosomal protein L25/general stress protein Ctc [Bacillus sp. ISL-51]|uniref:50S ribosomal protein L25/general stress protein Ctc n=1 Tax=Bacteria TaxID=2 RepID=UPI001BE54500|nr:MULTISPECIES: 50S ribosomal protein L25/general stress protein Ctc [Bacteria]MBT2575104.1 50S ribosomal protein L25/general stress protein Ctc [Bacillus sp. ISL-51]MBT2636122.1 50S ribosomal protein L25/general stress protein Ctc [Bacillus sp. ISL-26]MBT2713913.1 50S ribosomal protein L25/general stress protein Ctc [Pseudomonas sp. ISL-88]
MATLKANERTDFKRSTLRKIRHSGHVPGIIYGKETTNTPVSLDSIELRKTLRDEGKNAIITIDVNGNQQSVMVTDLQIDPLKNELTHADFQVVNMSEELEAEVPIQLTGEAKGVKDGGIIQQPLHELSIKAKPKDIPQTINIDISGLEMNDVLTIADLTADGSYTFMNEPEEVVASILPPKQEAFEEDAEPAPEDDSEGEKQ